MYYIYRPQTKLRKGNVFTNVCQEFCPRQGVVYLSACWDTHPLGRHPPWVDTPKEKHPSGAYTPRADAQSPWADTPPGRHPPPGQTPLGQIPPGQTLPQEDTSSRRLLLRLVRILLQCILVQLRILSKEMNSLFNVPICT